ncbi:MAG: putative repeat protein (TIGR01451 family)/MYXO-CTERM domain-containing protein, partial [Myxococcota bacterium]
LDVPTPDGFTGMEFWSVGENGDASVWLLGGDGTSTGIYHPSTGLTLLTPTRDGEYWDIGWPNAANAAGELMIYGYSDNDNTDLILRYAPCTAGSAPYVADWRVIYRTDKNPSFDFQVAVDDVCQTQLTDTATISTTSPETATDNNTDTATIAVNTADVSVTITSDPVVVQTGDTVTWTVTWENLGPGVASDVEVVVNLPAGTNVKGRIALPPVSTLGPGESGSETFSGQVISDEANLAMVATADIATPTIDCVVDNDTSSTTTTIGSYPNVYVTIEGPPTVTVGELATYTLTYGNNGNDTAEAVEVSYSVPSGLTVSSTPAGASIEGDVVTWVIGAVEPGTTAVVTVMVATNACDNAGDTVVHRADIATASFELDTSDNGDSTDAIVLGPAGELAVAIDDNRDTVALGEAVTVVVHYQSTGAAAVGGATLDLTLNGLNVVVGSPSADGAITAGGASWNLGDLAPGDNGSVLLQVAGDAQVGSLDAVLTGAGACDALASASGPETQAPGLFVTKSSDSATACAGGAPHVWSITVVNTSDSSIDGVVVTDPVPAGWTYVSGSIAGIGGSDDDPQTLRWDVGTLAAGTALTFTYMALPSDGGVLSGIVTGSTASVTAGESASTATALVPLICRPLVSLEKGWAPGCALTDGALTFTLNYKNNGNRPQTIEISDKLPAGTTFSGASVGTFDIVRQRFLATIIDVPPGGAGKITLEVQVDSGTAPGTLLTNRASFSAVDGQEVVTNGTSGQVAGGVLSCGDGNACTIDTCSPTMGCIYPNELQGTICNDGDACTQVDSCDEGACVGAQPVLCTALDQCHQAGMCDSATGVCSNPNVDDETTCDDQDACTSDDLCVAGTCVSGDVVDCDDDDQCTADSCDTQLGCMNAPQTDTPCEDGDLCSLDDFCVVGVCVSGDDKDCVASDQCHGVGVCNPESGECSDPVVPAETACDDGDPCTIDDVCAEGTCGGGAEVTCEAPNACFTAGSCTSGTGACEPVAVAGDVPYAPRLNDVGTLGGADSQALAVNDAGVVVGAAQTQDGSWHAFRYDGEGGMVDLTPNAGETGRAFAAHGVDLVFGVVDAAAGISVFVHDGTALTMLWATDSVDSAAASVFGPTSDGAVAGVGASGAQPTSSWYWTPGESTPTQISSDMGAAIATGIGEAGHVSGYVVTGDGTRRAFVWTSGGGMQLLAGLGGADSSAEAWDVDVDGVVVGASRNADDALRATHWSAAGTATDLGVLCSGADCAASSRATHINDGEIAGVSGDKLFYAASASTALVEVGTLGGASTVVAVDSGTVVCNTTTAWGTERAAVWTAATGLAELGTAGGDMARATSYNNGWVAGVTAAGGDVQRAFLWSAERRFEVLGTLGGASSAGAAVNASGLVVGWSDVGDEGGASHAFISDVPALACVACETDPDPPVLVCPIASGSVECVAGGAAIALGAPTAYDLCGLPVSVDDDAPDLFDVGVTPVTFSASDAEGNQATCVMQVAVEDTLPPTVTCPEAMEVASAVDVCGTAVELTATATDGCDEVVATIISNAPEIFPLGETTVTMTAVDAAGNQGSCETVITVVDETPLTLFCPEDYTVELPGDACETDEELTATVDDQCLVQVDVVVESETLGVGEHRVDFEANDNTGEAAACATIVTVVDVTPPTVDCGDVETLDRDALPIVVTSSASDACSATMSIEDVDCGLAADCQVQIDGGQLTVLALGYDLAEVTWTVVATDPSGNITREVCSFPFEPGIRDRDGDTIADDLDNCPDTPNTLQLDFDGDRIGNLCDLVDEGLVASGSGGCQSSSGAGSTLWLLLGVFGFAMLRRRRKERGYSVR